MACSGQRGRRRGREVRVPRGRLDLQRGATRLTSRSRLPRRRRSARLRRSATAPETVPRPETRTSRQW
eukprot:9387822-Pyramimonas_sp.AAC.1